MALTNISLVKSLLNIVGTSQDAWISSLQAAAEAVVESYCNRKFEKATYTEFYDGSGQKTLILRQTPVVSITSVHEDFSGYYGTGASAFAANTLLTNGVDYTLSLDGQYNGVDVSNSGILWRLQSVWAEIPRIWKRDVLTPQLSPSLGSVKVVYVAGYDPIPLDLQYAVAYVASSMRRTIPFGGRLESETIGDYSYRLHNARGSDLIYPEMDEARSILNRYRINDTWV